MVTNLDLNWEGIVHSNFFLQKALFVEKVNSEVIEKLSQPNLVKGIITFSGHVILAKVH